MTSQKDGSPDEKASEAAGSSTDLDECSNESVDSGETFKEDESAPTLQAKLVQAYEKSEGLQSKYVRALADLDNLRKRSARDREEAVKRCRVQILEDLLPVLDAFKIGLEEARKVESEGPVVNGFSMAVSQLESTLGGYGLTCIEATGDKFDPKLHEAIGYEESDEEDVVLKTIRSGYRMFDHLLRPASVLVSQKKSS